MKILGINAYHGDASACIIVNNQIVAAAEEERFTRIKHSAGFPFNSIKFCLENSKTKLSEINYLTINRNPKQKFLNKIIFASKNLFKLKFLSNRLSNLKKINSIKIELETFLDQKFYGKIINVDHHISHVASSVYFSNYKNSNFLSIDGFGDFTSTITGFYDGVNINKFDEVLFPHSLGLFYTAITQFLGFNNYGDEYKVMGLAPYGEPKYVNEISEMLIKKKNGLFNLNLKYFLHHTGNVEMTWMTGKPEIGKIFSNSIIELLGPSRKESDKVKKYHMDIACSAQKIYEEFLFEILNELYKKNQCDYLCISGGCGMNSVANGKIINNTKFKHIYLPSAPGDSGGAIGSAVFTINKKRKVNKIFSDNPYLGPEYNNKEILNELNTKSEEIEKKKIKIIKFNQKKELLKNAAKFISEGKILGFFNGRMEWGPRALGNRSILADPRNPNIREILNSKIKRREEFRPFAPSVLYEHSSSWFEVKDHVPFMSKVYQIKKNKRPIIPAVTHVDGSGRLQTVTRESNSNFYDLISFFYQLTNIPMVLNTSFNENEPIVCNPKEALNCFLRTRMDVLILGDYILCR
tara:strand:+ start:2793 stop:4529 length:1737 start_codon:yes stop_codon:yes gene_type:complete